MISDSPEPGFIKRLEAYLRRLCEARWQDPQGPLRLNRALTIADVQQAEFFHNTRQFLLALQEQGGTATTETGNLNRAFVRPMLDRMALSPLQRDKILQVNKVINETDLWALHLARIVSELAGLVARRSKRLKVTKQGAALLADERAGELYHTLFLTYFRKFDLHYDFLMRDVPSIQQGMAPALWRIDDVLTNWCPLRGLAPKILLPRVLEELRAAMVSKYDKEEWIFAGYVLSPLQDFGLIEKRINDQSRYISEEDSVRITPLWKKFISFEPFMG